MARLGHIALLGLSSFVFLLTLAMGCSSSSSGHEWVCLFDGKDLSGWQPCRPGAVSTWQVAGGVRLDPAEPKNLLITPGQGLLVNGPHGDTADICTVRQFADCEAHIEFMIPRHSNSGVYFMGEYEIQILDSYGHDQLAYEDCGGIYAYWGDGHTVGGTPPRVNACRPPGEWQTYDVVFRAPRFDAAGKKIENARFISVKHNGVLIHENVVLTATTAGGLTNQEHPRGPLRLQGDHGPVAFRNLRISASSND